MSRIFISKKVKWDLNTTKKCESSRQGAKRNQKPTWNHCGKIGHTSKKCWRNGREKFNGKCYNYNKHGHKANECNEKPKFEGKCHKCKRHGHKASECRSKSFNLAKKLVKTIFGWDYNTWCRCHYCGFQRLPRKQDQIVGVMSLKKWVNPSS